MKIITTDTRKLIEITLKYWDGSQWSYDQFGDLEDNWPREHSRDDDYNVIATQEEVDELIDFWRAETKDYKEGKNSILGEIDENQETEWLLDVFVDEANDED